MSQHKQQLNLIHTVAEPDDDRFRDPRQDAAQFVTDEQGNKMVFAGGKLYSVSRPGGEVADLVNVEFFNKLAELLIDRDIHAGQTADAARTVSRTRIDTEYDGAFLSWLRGGAAKWVYDVGIYHPENKAAREASAGMRAGVQATQNAMIATVMGAVGEQNRRTMTDIFGIQDYNRDRGRYEQEAIFEDKRVQEPLTIANAHELAKIDRETDRLIGLAKLETEARTAERADAALEADKNRSLEMYRETLGLTTDMANAINELRMIEQQQPTAQVIAAMEVLRATMDSAAAWATSLDEETKKRMAPYIAKMAGDAIAQAMRAARRG